MNQITTVSDQSDLTRRYWKFWYNASAHRLVLDYFAEERRQSPRHKWRPVRAYHRIASGRHSDEVEQREAPPIPPEVRQKIVQYFLDELEVGI